MLYHQHFSTPLTGVYQSRFAALHDFCYPGYNWNEVKVVPKSKKWKAKKKTKGPSKLCDQRGEWIDQLFSWNPCIIGDSPQGKGNKVPRFEQWRLLLPQIAVLLVVAWLQTSSKLWYPLQTSCSQLVIDVIIVPEINCLLLSKFIPVSGMSLLPGMKLS